MRGAGRCGGGRVGGVNNRDVAEGQDEAHSGLPRSSEQRSASWPGGWITNMPTPKCVRIIVQISSFF